MTKGSGVVVGLIDSGVDAEHPDLAGALLPGTSFHGSSSQAGHTDPEGHGTRMAGLIAARGGSVDNALGIAPAAMLLPIAIRETQQSYADAIRWAVDHGADVISFSIGRAALQPGEEEAVAYAQQHDVVFVTAVGNLSEVSAGNAFGPLPGVLTVSGLGESGLRFSDSVRADYAVVAAPAENIVSTGPLDQFKSGYSMASGTSDACAIVSGIVALIRARFPELDAANVVNRVIATAADRGRAGRDDEFGFGAVNARLAVTEQVETVDENPLGEIALEESEPGADPDDAASGLGPSDSTCNVVGAPRTAAAPPLLFLCSLLLGALFRLAAAPSRARTRRSHERRATARSLVCDVALQALPGATAPPGSRRSRRCRRPWARNNPAAVWQRSRAL